MKSYSTYPDFTSSGLGSLADSVRRIVEGKCEKVDLGHGTKVYKVPSPNPKKFTVRIDMKIEEE